MYLALTVSITVYSYMDRSPALNVEAIRSCDTLVTPNKITRRHTPYASNF
jgi:hypothetical protein